MDINTIRNRLSKIIRDIQYEKIEIMKLVGRESMTIIKTNSIITQKPFDLKALNRHLSKSRRALFRYRHFVQITVIF